MCGAEQCATAVKSRRCGEVWDGGLFLGGAGAGEDLVAFLF